MEVQKTGEQKFYRAKIDSSGRVVIPADTNLRKITREGEEVFLVEDETGIHIKTLAQSVREAQELFRQYIPAGVSLVDELSRERREEAARE
jgi:bifunctional DNA-binding transcriptional regulator/antitoxin component of YhaV-PrlF toxin-antitoxin module